VIVAYRLTPFHYVPPTLALLMRFNIDPIIFRPLKSLTLANTQQESLLKLAQEGVSVYSPHTAVDAAIGGVNDWLADGISGGRGEENERVVIERVNDVPGLFD